MKESKDVYISIGTGKACCFVINSKHLMGILRRFPLLYYASRGNWFVTSFKCFPNKQNLLKYLACIKTQNGKIKIVEI